jgi:Nucleotidyl transferase AbiEii toxin, Type IV TA system
MAAGDSTPDLSAFQLEVARLFFALPASRGFLLAGGAALLAQHLTARPTEDLDFFTAPEQGNVLSHAMPWRPRGASEAGLCSESMTATRSAGWSSAALRPGS